jgi:hypothetical protein
MTPALQNLHRSDANLTLGVPSQASKSVKFSIRPMLMSYIALVESKKDYSEGIRLFARVPLFAMVSL